MTAATAYARSDEGLAVAALLKIAAFDDIEAAGLRAPGPCDESDAEGLRLAAEHGVDPTRIAAYRSLAHSRGLDLEQVLRAAFRGELREVVELPKATAS